MAPKSPIEFVRRLVNGRTQECGNRVQLEDENAAAINAANPLDVAIAAGGNDVNLAEYGGAAVGPANPVDVELVAGGVVEVEQATHDNLNCNANIQVGNADVGAANPVPAVDTWEIVLVADEAANDSDKTYTFPAGYIYQVLGIRVEITSTATAGDRQLAIQLLDTADDIVEEYRPRLTQAATLAYNYQFGPGLAQDTAIYDTDHCTTPIAPSLIIPAGYDLRIYDNNAVDAAADDMIVRLRLARRAV